jgi:agmatine/peptidylarginine deiminase
MEYSKKIFSKKDLIPCILAFTVGLSIGNYLLSKSEIMSLQKERRMEETYETALQTSVNRMKSLVYAYEHGSIWFDTTQDHIDSLKNYAEYYQALSDSHEHKKEVIDDKINFLEKRADPRKWFF